MAGAGARKRLEENQSRLTMLLVLCLVGTATFIAVRLTMYKQSTYLEHWIGYAATILIELLVYVAIRAAAQPVFDAAGRLLDGGADLNKGMVSSYHDLLYMTVLVQLVAAFSNWGWLIYAIVPGYGLYYFTTKALIPALKEEAPQQQDEATMKRRMQTRSDRRPVRRM